jgi:hypothetical protein
VVDCTSLISCAAVFTAPFTGPNPVLTAKTDCVPKGQKTQEKTSLRAYNSVVAESVKVPKEEFERVIRALLNAPPTPMADMPHKRKAKAKRQAVKARG